MILSIDPGNEFTAFTLINEEDGLKPIEIGKVENNELLEMFKQGEFKNVDFVAIEMIACYGMAVGKSVFETCLWIGRFTQLFADNVGIEKITYIYRKDEKMNLCGSMKAKDGNIRQALIDRFGVVGVKANQGWFYGFKADIWAAYAVGVTFHDMFLNKGGKNKC